MPLKHLLSSASNLRISRPHLARWWLACLALVLAACGSLPKAAPNYSVHDFGPLDSAMLRPLGFQIRSAEVVPAPWLASTAMQYRLAYAQPTRRQFYLESRWVAQPGQLVELAVKRSMKTSETAVSSSGCRLRVDLDEFVQVFDDEVRSRGLVEARATLLAPRTDQLIATRGFAVTRPAPTPDAVGGVLALREGVLQLNRELLDWLDAVDREGAERPRGGVRSRCSA